MRSPIVPIGDRRPLSLRVYEGLWGRIAAGDYPPGERLPSEEQLARAFAVSRVTVREALRLLQRDGLVIARHGRGHFVLQQALIREPITELRSVTELLAALGYAVETEVLDVQLEPAGEPAEVLDLEPGASVRRIERIRSSGGETLIYSIDVVPEHMLEGATADFSGSLMAILEGLGIVVARAQATIRATILPRGIARRVGLGPSLPWLLLEQVHFGEDDTPVLWSRDYHRGDRFEFNVLRQRHRG